MSSPERPFPDNVVPMPGVVLPEPTPEPDPTVCDGLAFNGALFRRATLPTREIYAVNGNGEPFFKAHSIAAIGAQPGIGKTMIAGAMAVAASLGDAVFGLQWVRPLRVLTIDMELSAEEAQERYDKELRGREASENWRLVCSDALDVPVRALYDPEELSRLMPLYEWAEIVIIDTASHALPTEDDNSTTSWKPCEDFLLMLRRMGKLVIVTFHLNASGTRIRGTSAKTQAVDWVGIMKRPDDSEEDGCHYSISWTKHRGVSSSVAVPWEAWQTPHDGWQYVLLTEKARRENFEKLLDTKMPVKDAAETIGIPLSTAYRWRADLKKSGRFR